MESIKDSLTFDDVSLVPQHSSIVPNETITSVELFKNLKLINLILFFKIRLWMGTVT